MKKQVRMKPLLTDEWPSVRSSFVFQMQAWGFLFHRASDHLKKCVQSQGSSVSMAQSMDTGDTGGNWETDCFSEGNGCSVSHQERVGRKSGDFLKHRCSSMCHGVCPVRPALSWGYLKSPKQKTQCTDLTFQTSQSDSMITWLLGSCDCPYCPSPYGVYSFTLLAQEQSKFKICSGFPAECLLCLSPHKRGATQSGGLSEQCLWGMTWKGMEACSSKHQTKH